MNYYAQGRREKEKPTGVLEEGGSNFLMKRPSNDKEEKKHPILL